MSHFAFGPWTLKSIAAVMLMTAGAVGTHSSGAEAIRYSDHVVESAGCRSNDEDRGHDNAGHGNSGHGGNRRGHDRGRKDPPHGSGGVVVSGSSLQQILSVRVPATVFVRVDKSGRVTAAATNTGCRPSRNDSFFVFRGDGVVAPATTIDADDCEWTGNFTVPGRFQPQACRSQRHGRDGNDSHHRHDD